VDPSRRTFPQLPPVLVAVAPFLDLRTWGAVVYVWLGFPLGLAWFVGLIVGFAVGVPLTILWIGFAVLAATLAFAWMAEGLERQLAIHLLGAAVPPRLPRTTGDGMAGVRSVLGSSALWKGMLFLALRFPLGLVGWIFSLVSLVVSTTFLLAPWVELVGWEEFELAVNVDWLYWPIDSTFDLWLLSFVGLVMMIGTLHAHRALGFVWARLAEWLLGGPAPAPAAPETTRSDVDAAWSTSAPAAPAAT
jgi:hypothetical protein